MWNKGHPPLIDGKVYLALHNRGTWISDEDKYKINCVVVYYNPSQDRFNMFGTDSFSLNEICFWKEIEEVPKDYIELMDEIQRDRRNRVYAGFKHVYGAEYSKL